MDQSIKESIRCMVLSLLKVGIKPSLTKKDLKLIGISLEDQKKIRKL